MKDYIMRIIDPPEKDYDEVGRISCTNCRYTIPYDEAWYNEDWEELYGRASLCEQKPATTVTQPNIDWCMLFTVNKE